MRDIPASLHNLGHVAAAQGDYRRAREFFGESMALHVRLGNNRGVGESLAGLAGLAAAEGQPERAARLFGAAGLREAAGPTMWPAERTTYERNLATARAQLDESAWAAAYAEGQAMTPEQAVAYALEP
jgi:hypothetical protein